MTTLTDSGGPLQFCPYHKCDEPQEGFSGKNRYCRVGLNEYRRARRVRLKLTRDAFVAEGAQRCPLCKTNPIMRRNAKRCPACIKANKYMCACGRVTHHPVCGKCRWKKTKAINAARRLAIRRIGVKVTTGDARCAQCGTCFPRDPAGNIIMRHDCG
jgi:hypothetical protein